MGPPWEYVPAVASSPPPPPPGSSGQTVRPQQPPPPPGRPTPPPPPPLPEDRSYVAAKDPEPPISAPTREAVSESGTPALEASSIEVQAEQVAEPKQPVMMWTKYAANAELTSFWWWCEADNDCFVETDPGDWREYLDPNSGKTYWWNTSNEKWFWPHSGSMLA